MLAFGAEARSSAGDSEPMAEAPPPHVPPQVPVETPPAEPPAPPVEAGRPFWAENVNRDDTFEDIKDISEFPDVYEEPEAPAPEGFAEDVMEHPAPVAEPVEEEAPFVAYLDERRARQGRVGHAPALNGDDQGPDQDGHEDRAQHGA